MSHFASYISQIHHVSRSKHKFDVKSKYQSEKKVLPLKELENWVGNSKISFKVKMFYTSGFFCVFCFKNMDSSWILPEISII
jgi:hypothetical protein